MNRKLQYYKQHTLGEVIRQKIWKYIDAKLRKDAYEEINEGDRDVEIQEFTESHMQNIEDLQIKLEENVKDTSMNNEQKEEVKLLSKVMEEIRVVEQKFLKDLSASKKKFALVKRKEKDDEFFEEREIGKMSEANTAIMFGILSVVISVCCLVFTRYKNSCKSLINEK